MAGAGEQLRQHRAHRRLIVYHQDVQRLWVGCRCGWYSRLRHKLESAWEQHRKTAALPGCALDQEPAIVGLNDPIADRQTEPGSSHSAAAKRALGSHKWLE